MHDRIKRIKKYIETHRYQTTFVVGAVVGGLIVRSRYTELKELLHECEELLDQPMEVQVTTDEIRTLLDRSTSGLVSRSGENHGGDIFITLK